MRKSQIGTIVMLLAATFAMAGCSRVGEDWKAAQTADSTEAYQDFLRQHPDSEFGVSAQERIKQLAEDRDWQAASKADTLDAYQQFVATHADGKWAQEARVRIENFQLAGGAGNTGNPPPAGSTSPMPAVGAPTNVAPPSAPATAATKPAAAKPAASAAKASAGSGSGSHYAQLGAYASKASAESAWHTLNGRFSSLKSLQPHYASGTSHGKTVVRLQVGLASSERARDLCAALKKQSQACIPVS
ncbi:MAG: SPOR domain-containing protein [Steroidobacteraceae bacterium]